MANIDTSDPQNSVGYWLFYAQRCVAYAFAETMRVHCLERSKPYIVTPPQWGALSLLRSTDGLTVGTISQQRGIDAPTVTGIIKRLEQAGLVERRHDRDARRIVKVYLTREGHDITQSLTPVIRAFYAEMLGDFSIEQQELFLFMLQKIILNVSDETLGTGDRFKLLPPSLPFQQSM